MQGKIATFGHLKFISCQWKEEQNKSYWWMRVNIEKKNVIDQWGEQGSRND